MELAFAREPLHGDDRVAVGLGSQDEARADECPVEQHGARAALPLLAGVLRSGQPEPLAQEIEEALAAPGVGLPRDAVHGQCDPHARHLSSARRVRTRNACRRYPAEPRTSSIGRAASATRSGNPSASASGAVTSVGTGAAEPNAARTSPRSRSTASASEQTAIT